MVLEGHPIKRGHAELDPAHLIAFEIVLHNACSHLGTDTAVFNKSDWCTGGVSCGPHMRASVCSSVAGDRCKHHLCKAASATAWSGIAQLLVRHGVQTSLGDVPHMRSIVQISGRLAELSAALFSLSTYQTKGRLPQWQSVGPPNQRLQGNRRKLSTPAGRSLCACHAQT